MPPPKDAAGKIFDEAVDSIESKFHYAFLSTSNLRKKLQRVHAKHEGNTAIRLVVTGVNEEAVDAAMRTLPFCPFLRVWFESDTAIIRMIMTSGHHENTCGQFNNEIVGKILQIPGHNPRSFRAVGATRFHSPGRRSKEGDAGFKCASRTGIQDWPNLMIEVGYSEPLSQLHLDAKWWLVASNGQTRMVIIILVSTNPNSLHIEVWEMHANPNRRSPRSPVNIPTMSYALDIDGAGTVNSPNGSLTIPYTVLFDNPHPNAQDIVFNKAELSTIAVHIFNGFQ